ncbi:MAG: hypothetical protein IJG68_06050 [Bacilli bacterium]|nr:hypothetical protein [Bacilli bacterium]
MGYRLENKSVELDGIRKLNFVPSMKAGDVYRYHNYALRIFRDGEKTIDEDTARYLTNITTEKVLLPKKLLFYNNVFKGYTMKLVSQKGTGKKIITTPKDEFLNTVEDLEEDIELLSQKKVLLNDIAPGYTLYNGELYLVNPARYSVFEGGDETKLESLNKYQLQLLLVELISGELNKQNFSQSAIKSFKELMSLRDLDQNPSAYLDEIIGDQKDIKQLIKKIS